MTVKNLTETRIVAESIPELTRHFDAEAQTPARGNVQPKAQKPSPKVRARPAPPIPSRRAPLPA